MQKFKEAMRAGLLYVLAVVLVGSYPMAAMAEETTPPSGDTTQTAVVPPPKTTYTYNPDTSRWDSDKWQYDPGSGQYQSTRPAPVPVTTVGPAVADSQPATVAGPDSQNTQSLEASKLSDTNVNTNATVGNSLMSTATSGNAGVDHNMLAGNAGSGNANADTTIVNTLHSSVQGDTAGIAYFQSDIYGNVSGDITLSPAINGATKQPASQTTGSTLQVDANGQIVNDLTLNATSGNADVTKNTLAGSATTGSANTVANLVNLINSIIAANKSFIGTINIYGNLNGDILVSPEFIPQLIASNAPNVASPLTNSLSANLNDSQSIINNISLNAASGQANVEHNTSAGGATTGTAATNLTILNLTGHQVVAKNSLLVFVNVLGKWVGIIVDAPIGATAAAFGNGVTSNTLNSTDQTIATNNTSGITNNLNLNSLSGNANVTGNTSAGNATSGNATASANVVNMITSSFSLSDWFGILFINVFGEWHGSFGINTASGEVIPLDGMALPEPSSVTLPQAFKFGFVPHASPGNNLDKSAAYFISQQNGDDSGAGDGATVRLASTNLTGGNSQMILTPEKTPERNLFAAITTTTVGFFLTAIGIALEILRRRHSAVLA